MNKIKLGKRYLKTGLVYYTDHLIGTGYWCGAASYVFPRVSLARELVEKLDNDEEFAVRNGESVDPPDIRRIIAAGEVEESDEHKLTPTSLLLRNKYVREEFPPIMIFRHPSGRFVGISYEYFPLVDGIDLYQAEKDQGISGYLNGELVLFVMPVRVDPRHPIEKRIRTALGETVEVAA